MTPEEIEDSIAGLLAASQQQGQVASESISALVDAIKELRSTSGTLRTGVERAISENMGKVSQIAEKAVLEASKASSERLNAAAVAVAATQKQFSLWWVFVPAAVTACLTVLAIVVFLVFTDNARTELAEAKAAVAKLEPKGGKAKLGVCGDNRQLCVKVDKSAEYNNDFMVIKGY